MEKNYADDFHIKTFFFKNSKFSIAIIFLNWSNCDKKCFGNSSSIKQLKRLLVLKI